MRHLRTDWAGVQDSWQPQSEWARRNQETGGRRQGSTIGQDEPVFLIRSKSETDWQTVRDYAQHAREHGSAEDYCQRIERWAGEMEAYGREHFTGQHAPDAPELLP